MRRPPPPLQCFPSMLIDGITPSRPSPLSPSRQVLFYPNHVPKTVNTCRLLGPKVHVRLAFSSAVLRAVAVRVSPLSYLAGLLHPRYHPFHGFFFFFFFFSVCVCVDLFVVLFVFTPPLPPVCRCSPAPPWVAFRGTFVGV